MKPTRSIARYAGTAGELVEELGNLYYDSLAEHLRMLAEKIARDAEADARRNRPRLAAELAACSRQLELAASHIGKAWEICAPHDAGRT